MSKSEGAGKKDHLIWIRVSEEENERIREEAENHGCSMSFLLKERGLGRQQVAPQEHRRAVRQIVSACHVLKAAVRDGRADPDQAEALTEAALGLLADLVARGR